VKAVTIMSKSALVLALALAAAPAAPSATTGSAQTVNCVAAVVNGQIITRLDVEITAAFGMAGQAAEDRGGDARLAALDALIDRKIVLDLAREARSVGKDEIGAALAELRRSIGEEGFRARLARFGLVAKDLEPYLEDLILYDRALALRFSQSIPVSVTEVERHYRDIYVPEQARLGVPAEPLDKVAGTIETRIRDDRRAQQTSVWVRDLRKTTEIQIRKDCLK
jgi:parvulin-like peptidyl-prolyl isomerase